MRAFLISWIEAQELLVLVHKLRSARADQLRNAFKLVVFLESEESGRFQRAVQ